MPHPLEPEQDRLARVAAGSRADFDRLYDSYFPRVYGLAMRRLGERQAAERVTRQVFLELVEALPAWRGGAVSGWLFERTRQAIDCREA